MKNKIDKAEFFLPEYEWISFLFVRKNISLNEVALKANCSLTTLTDVICGKWLYQKIRDVIAAELGYPSWKELWADAVLIEQGKQAVRQRNRRSS